MTPVQSTEKIQVEGRLPNTAFKKIK